MVYGGRKNCSSTTYIPRIISARRKYLPALSSAVSLLSYHLFARGKRKPEGGGPEGVTERRADEEKGAMADREQDVCEGRVRNRIDVGRARASVVSVRVAVIVTDAENGARGISQLDK